MKRIVVTFGSLFFSLVLSITILNSCNNKPDDRADERDTATAMPADTHTTRNDFLVDRDSTREQFRRKMDEIESELRSLDERLKSEKGKTKEDSQKRRDELEQRRLSLRERMDKIGERTEQEWEQFKSEYKSDMNDLENRVENFFDDRNKKQEEKK